MPVKGNITDLHQQFLTLFKIIGYHLD